MRKILLLRNSSENVFKFVRCPFQFSFPLNSAKIKRANKRINALDKYAVVLRLIPLRKSP